MHISKGDVLKLRAYRLQIIERKTVAVRRKTVYVCLESEYEQAISENREPECIGFPISDIIHPVAEAKIG
jgi:hypothetical protein